MSSRVQTGWRAKLNAPFELEFEPIRIDPSEQPADWIVARTVRTAVSLGTERAAYVGDPPLRPGPVYPRKMGYCNVACVEHVGPDVHAMQVGDHVLTHQSHQSIFACAAADVLAVLPSSLPPRSAAFAYLFALGLAALQRAHVQATESVAVLGLGAIGLATVSVAGALGARAYAIGNDAHRIELARRMGALHAWNSDDPILHASLAAAAGTAGADVVVTTANAWSAWRTALQLARPNGRVAVLGFPGRGEPPPAANPLDPALFYDKQLTLHAAGMTTGLGVDGTLALHRNMRWLVSQMEQGKLSAEPLITHDVAWDQLPAIYAAAHADRRAVVGAALDWSSCRG